MLGGITFGVLAAPEGGGDLLGGILGGPGGYGGKSHAFNSRGSMGGCCSLLLVSGDL